MASATVPATVGGARRPAAVAGSATTADSADGAVGYPRTTQAIWPQPSTVGHPAKSHALAAVTQQLLDGALSPLTTRSHKKNVDMFQQFCKLEFFVNNWFPSKTSAVVSFIVFCFKKGYAASSITSALSAISYVHKMKNLEDPTASFVVRNVTCL